MNTVIYLGAAFAAFYIFCALIDRYWPVDDDECFTSKLN